MVGGQLCQAQLVVQFSDGEQSGVGGDGGDAELHLHTATELHFEGLGAFTHYTTAIAAIIQLNIALCLSFKERFELSPPVLNTDIQLDPGNGG